MTIKLTYDEIAALKPCSLDKIPAFGKRKTLNARQALAAGVSLDDLLWVAGKLNLKRQCVQFSLACAQRVAHLNPDLRVQAALDATQAWLDNPCPETEAAAWAASDAAWAARAAAAAARAAARAASDAAWAAWAASDAAWAASDAAWAASDAASAAASAARAAASAAASEAAERKEQEKIFLKIFK